MNFTEQQIETLAPNPAAFKAGKSLSSIVKWQLLSKSERALWGEIKGSGSSPYKVQIDLTVLAYKCSCPSRQFPCKHCVALMLLYSSSANDFSFSENEPEHIQTWIDKRQSKPKEGKKEEEERTEEELEKLGKAKAKTQANRFESVMAGAIELELWLKDLIRLGLLELPNKPSSDFSKVAARMVDAKAPGLASWVKSLGNLNFSNQNEWPGEAMTIISKLFLLIKTFRNFDNLSPEWQITIKNLIGWSQSTKELLDDNNAERIKDFWLVAGQETETNDDIVTQRNWLIGCNSQRRALILNFATRFSSFENLIVPGSILHADLAFFPSVTPHRAVVKMQRNVELELPVMPDFADNWTSVFQFRANQLKLNPWANDLLVLVRNVRLMNSENQWIVFDTDNKQVSLVPSFDLQKVMKWMIVSGNRPQDIAFILRNGKVIPLGIFKNHQYILL